MRIVLDIDELVLEGHDPRRRRATADAIGAALASPTGASVLARAIGSWGDTPGSAGQGRPSGRDTGADLGSSVVRAIGTALTDARPPATTDGAS